MQPSCAHGILFVKTERQNIFLTYILVVSQCICTNKNYHIISSNREKINIPRKNMINYNLNIYTTKIFPF